MSGKTIYLQFNRVIKTTNASGLPMCILKSKPSTSKLLILYVLL